MAVSVALLPCLSHAGCKSALPTESLHPLDAQVDVDPMATTTEVERRLAALGERDPLQAAELYAINADAYDLSDDAEKARLAVIQGRARLAAVPDGAAKHIVLLRLEIIDADQAFDPTGMAAAVERLTRLEPALPANSLDRVCLLIIRSRVSSELYHDEEATADAITAYRLARELHSPTALADAAYQSGMTYERAGLIQDAALAAEEAVRQYRANRHSAGLSDALYLEGVIRLEERHYEEALTALDEARAINQRLHQEIEIAFDDRRRCEALLELQQVTLAQQACLSAEKVLQSAYRTDLLVDLENSLARIDILRGSPGAAILRLNKVLTATPSRVPARTVPKLYETRAEALGRIGRSDEALQDMQSAARLMELNDTQQTALKAAKMKERLTVEIMRKEQSALKSTLQAERIAATVDEARLSWQLAAAAAAGLIYIIAAYVLWNRMRQERARRELAERLENQVRVLDTMREGVLLVDANNRIEYANAGAARLLGQPRESLPGRSLDSVGISAEKLKFGDVVESAGVPLGTVELTLTDPKGTTTSVLLSRSWATLSAQSLLLYVLHDVTELRRLEHEVLSANLQERDQVSREIHDGMAQDLAGIAQLLEGISVRTEGDASRLAGVLGHVTQTIARTVSLASGLSPVKTAGGSLSVALARFAQEMSAATGITVSCQRAVGEARLSEMQTDYLYRVAVRCAQLAARQPGCRTISIEVEGGAGGLELSVASDGDALSELNSDDRKAWEFTAYLARIIGGQARLVVPRNAGLRSVVSIALADATVTDARAAELGAAPDQQKS